MLLVRHAGVHILPQGATDAVLLFIHVLVRDGPSMHAHTRIHRNAFPTLCSAPRLVPRLVSVGRTRRLVLLWIPSGSHPLYGWVGGTNFEAHNNGNMDGIGAAHVRLVVLGCGTVGRALIQLVKRSDRAHVYAVCDSKHVAMAPKGAFAIGEEALSVLAQAKRDKKSFEDAKEKVGDRGFQLETKEKGMRKLMQSLVMERKGGGCGFVFADCTATKETSTMLLDALQIGAGVALANKVPVAGDQSLFDALMKYDARMRCESTVLAGTPAVAALRRIVMAKDRVKRLAGAFSGTLGYVCDGLERGLVLSQAVKEAMQAGYTEPDPRDDLGGMDVARKALILARHMGWKMELTDVDVQSLFPDHMAQDKMGVKEFVAGMGEMDEGMKIKAEEANAAGKVLRYVATVEGGCCRVGLEAVPKESPLGRLKGTDNLLEVHSEFYDPEPLVIQGRGAGPEITAAGVLADAIEIASTL